MVGVGINANFSFRVGGNASFSVFRYQHVGIPNAKLWRWGSKQTQGPNVNGFASQWNIGFTVFQIAVDAASDHLRFIIPLRQSNLVAAKQNCYKIELFI